MQSVWVRQGALRWWRDWRPQRWVDAGVALEQSTRADGRKDSIFFVYYTQYDEKKVGGSLGSKLRPRKTPARCLGATGVKLFTVCDCVFGF